MTEPGILAPTYNPFEPGYAENPYPTYARLRETEPVHHSPFGFWMLFGYDDVVRFLRDPSLSVEDRNLTEETPLRKLVREVRGDDEERGRYSMLRRDPPDHTRLRKLVTKAFTPRVVEELRPRVQRIVDELLARAAAGREVDLIADFAFPLPFTVISQMLGIPEADGAQLRAWSGILVRTLEPMTVDPELIKRITDASDRMGGFIADMIAWKRRNPGDDLLTALIAAEENGDVLSEDELLEQVMLLYIAGHETTVNLIGNGTLALLRDPAERHRFASDPATAVEELLRYDSPVQLSRRITLDDVEIDGHRIAKGSFVVLGLASANRDESRWGPDAGRLDLARADAHQHRSFGGGVHYCLGASLARLEGQVAIGSLLRRFPNVELAGDPAWNGRLNLRGLDRLPVRLGDQSAL